MTKKETIELYYKCMGDKTKDPLFEILRCDMVFLSQYGKYSSRDRMIDDIWPNVGKTKARELQIFGDGDQYMVKYKIKHDQKDWTNSEYIEFVDGKIARIEVFIGFEIKE